MVGLQSAIDTLPNIGVFYQKKLNRLKINTLFDLVTHAPRAYELREKNVSFRDIVPGEKNAVVGKVLDCRVITTRRRMLLVTLTDGMGLLTLRFFHFYPNQVKQLAPGQVISAFGEVKLLGGNYEMLHPQYEVAVESTQNDEERIAIYPLTEGVSQKRMAGFIEAAFNRLQHSDEKLLPAEILRRAEEICQEIPAETKPPLNFMQALKIIHFPMKPDLDALNRREHAAQGRLIFEELLAHRLAISRAHDPNATANAIELDETALQSIMQTLPFTLTAGQSHALHEILTDMQKTKPMQRLLQGDVGSGKTIVALLAAYAVIQQGMQVALMAPTEILAEQLHEKASLLLAPFGVNLALLLGKSALKSKRDLYAKIENNEVQLVIGTHALIQEKVIFNQLGLIIIDEQHRFGVGQRLSLHQKGLNVIVPHQLIMSATPIPRTLAMSLYADLGISNIYELPQGRRPIETALVSQLKREAVIERLEQVCHRGEQAYWICPLIETSDKLELEATEALYNKLQNELADIKIGLLHGRMTGSEKSAVMQAFKEKKIQILVATTVVEVGVDVPNATIMIIENPERMGLSQLHQLRGRVGRGHKQSFCVLLYRAPLNETALERLKTLKYAKNGFELAEKDLELRGAGDFLGTRQTGGLSFRFASLIQDQRYLKAVHKAADIMQKKYPNAARTLVEKWFAGQKEYIQV